MVFNGLEGAHCNHQSDEVSSSLEDFVTNFVFVPSLSYRGRQVQNLGMFEHFISRSPLFGADTKQSFQHIPNNRPIVGHRVCQSRGSKCEECLQIINDDEASKRLKSSLSTPLGRCGGMFRNNRG